MTAEVEGRIEKRMNGIADDLVDHSTMLHDDRRHPFNVLVKHGDQLLGTRPMRHGGKILDVGEQRGDFAVLAAELQQVRILGDSLHDFGRQMLRETAPDARFAPADHRVRADGGRHEDDKATERRHQRIDQAIRGQRDQDCPRPGERPARSGRRRLPSAATGSLSRQQQQFPAPERARIPSRSVPLAAPGG